MATSCTRPTAVQQARTSRAGPAGAAATLYLPGTRLRYSLLDGAKSVTRNRANKQAAKIFESRVNREGESGVMVRLTESSACSRHQSKASTTECCAVAVQCALHSVRCRYCFGISCPRSFDIRQQTACITCKHLMRPIHAVRGGMKPRYITE